MRSDKNQKGSITGPLLKDLVDREKADSKLSDPTIGSAPLAPPALYEDSGEGYNSNFVFPQD